MNASPSTPMHAYLKRLERNLVRRALQPDFEKSRTLVAPARPVMLLVRNRPKQRARAASLLQIGHDLGARIGSEVDLTEVSHGR